ncbi:hypothetical protein GCM10027359_10910 [Marilutibacter aestuarii]
MIAGQTIHMPLKTMPGCSRQRFREGMGYIGDSHAKPDAGVLSPCGSKSAERGGPRGRGRPNACAGPVAFRRLPRGAKGTLARAAAPVGQLYWPTKHGIVPFPYASVSQ